MTTPITTGGVHHLTLTVTHVNRARAFYTELLGFQQIAEFGPRVLLSNGSLILALGPAPDPQRAMNADCFDENRVGLDHVSLSVSSRADLEAAAHRFGEYGVPHGEIKDLEAFGLYVLAFRDPDNIQLELTAAYR